MFLDEQFLDEQEDKMLTLFKGLDCYIPKHIGKNDILVCADKIYKIQPEIDISDKDLLENVYDCSGLYAFPGFIDQHVHIIGGGGENGFSSRTAEIDINDIWQAGVTTLVGLLGADSCTRSLNSLYAKAKALEAGGLTTFVYAGCYTVPPVTFTGDIVQDLILIDKVIGVGEIAVSDHRSSHADREHLLKLASAAHLGGLLGGKAGVVHLHMGDGKAGLSPLLQLIENSDLPMEQFVPTHVNRNLKLFRQAVEYCKSGGNIDLTSGEEEGISVPDAIQQLIDSGITLSHVTVSSDSNGSIPEGGAARIQSLYDDIFYCIRERKLNPETAVSLVTQNSAKILKIYPKKGTLQKGSDADILITDKNYEIRKLVCLGKVRYESQGC